MQVLFDMISRIQSLDEGKVFYLSVDNDIVKKLIVQLNTDNQLRFGELADGSILPNYSLTSQKVYGKPNAPISLHDTGEFWESFRITNVTEFDLTVEVDDYYNLLRRYSLEVIGLNEENTQRLIDKLVDEYKKHTLDAILG